MAKRAKRIQYKGYIYESRSDLAMDLLQNTRLTLTEIANNAKITVQTVFAIRKKYSIARPNA
jgi:hypothetical protein